eukprot:Pompholyxophrys_punicea_v1_NODE_96_length_3522_cov_38.680127.p2 type:complete len:357 gc:universal NODE_96_length_3522_cov_38.680127:200-1270(+)
MPHSFESPRKEMTNFPFREFCAEHCSGFDSTTNNKRRWAEHLETKKHQQQWRLKNFPSRNVDATMLPANENSELPSTPIRDESLNDPPAAEPDYIPRPKNDFYPFPSKTFAMLFFWIYLVVGTMSEEQIRSLLVILQDKDFNAHHVPKFEEFQNIFTAKNFPYQPPVPIRSDEGTIFLNTVDSFLKFFLGVPGRIKLLFPFRREVDVMTETVDGAKLKIAPFFWLKCFPFSSGYLYLEDVVKIGDFFFWVIEFVEMGSVKCVRVFRVVPMTLLGFLSDKYVVTSLEFAFALSDVEKIVEVDLHQKAAIQNGEEWRLTDDDGPTKTNWFQHPTPRQKSQGKPYLTFPLTLFSDEWGG